MSESCYLREALPEVCLRFCRSLLWLLNRLLTRHLYEMSSASLMCRLCLFRIPILIGILGALCLSWPAHAQTVPDRAGYYNPAGGDGVRGTADDDYRPNHPTGSPLVDFADPGPIGTTLALNGQVQTVQTIFGEQVTCTAGSGGVPFYFSDPVVFVAMLAWFGIAATLSYYTFAIADL